MSGSGQPSPPGTSRRSKITELAELTEYAGLRKRFGDGESAAMAVAFTRHLDRGR